MVRRTFITGLASGLILKLPVSALALNIEQPRKTAYRIAPLPGKTYSPAFLEFCRNSQFFSIESAMRAIHSKGTEFMIQPVPV